VSRVEELVAGRRARRLSLSRRMLHRGAAAAVVLTLVQSSVTPIQRIHHVTEELFEDVLP
jgi:hypothetical protein